MEIFDMTGITAQGEKVPTLQRLDVVGRLRDREAHLKKQLSAVQDAISIAERNPDVIKLLDAVNRAL